MEIESQFPGQHPQFDSSECKKVKAHSETTVITERVPSCRPDVRALRPAPREMSPVSHKYFCDSGGCKICTSKPTPCCPVGYYLPLRVTYVQHVGGGRSDTDVTYSIYTEHVGWSRGKKKEPR